MSSNVADALPASTPTVSSGDLLGHPKGLYICFATELWERFSFYGMKALLLLYLTKYHLFTDSAGYRVLGAYAGLVYALPLIGGVIADRYLGMRKAVLFGGILLCLGHLLMAFEGREAVSYAAGTVLTHDIILNNGTLIAAGTTLTGSVVIQDVIALKVFFMALALITVGVGFLKPNISTLVGRLYGENDPRRDSGFTIFYMGINVGAFAATILCGWLGETYGWGYGFGLAGIGMVVGLITFVKGQKYLSGLAEPSRPEVLKQKAFGPLNKEWAVYLGSFAALGVVWFLMQNEPVVHLAQNSLLIVSIVGLVLYSMLYQDSKARDPIAIALALATAAVGLVWAFTDADIWLVGMLAALAVFIGYGFKAHYSEEFSRTVVLMVLIASTIVFWALFEQAYGSMTLFADRVVDRSLGSREIGASMFLSLNAAFIMLLAIPFATLWVWLSRRNLEPSTPVKFGLAIIQVGLGFGALVLGIQNPNEVGQVAMIWLVLAYLLHTSGELCLSPVGLSAVTKLSIGKVVGASMGTWFLATALSETLAMRLGQMAAMDPETVTDTAAAAAIYSNLFEYLMWWGLGAGALMLLISPVLKKGMCGIR